ncbi:MAG TPA: hypothetical protein DCM32_02875 [Xanthomonadaceae bacterium]|jgi:uncharacterized membrane protein YedE/YeeE|nr:hypothetical protein [Xanthomonadaceae bacterium]
MNALELHWGWPVAGGLMIGIAAAIYLVGAGRVMGVTGLLARAGGLDRSGPLLPAALAIVGMLGGALLAALLIRMPTPDITGSWPLLLIGGLLVGYGTRLGSGCTSGHGVCGLARLSKRSIVATLVFMATAALTVFVMRHLVGAGA